jgi:hypothetical protein
VAVNFVISCYAVVMQLEVVSLEKAISSFFFIVISSLLIVVHS